MMSRALQVTKNPLDELPMSVRGRVHILTNTVEDKGDIGSSECTVLKGAKKMTILSTVRKHSTSRSRENRGSGHKSIVNF